jgi:hypothetical protein
VTKLVTNEVSKIVYNKTKKLETLDAQGFQAPHFSDSDWARTSDLHPVKVGVFLFHHENNLIKYPNKIPTIPNLNLRTSSLQIRASQGLGVRVLVRRRLKFHWQMPRKWRLVYRLWRCRIRRQRPPVKKCGIKPGTITFKPTSGKINIEIIPAAKLDKKPTMTAFGAYGNTAGQSSAGLASCTTLSAIPLNAGTISAMSIRTPANTTYTPAANVIPCIREKTRKLTPPLNSFSINCLPANGATIKNNRTIVNDIATDVSRRNPNDFGTLISSVDCALFPSRFPIHAEVK